jgi:ankyrin repeat protein
MRKGDIEIIFLLLDYGADLNAKNNKKQTPLYYCTKKMLKLLGLEDGTSAMGDSFSGQMDNNKLFFKPEEKDIYNEHYY